MSNVLFEGDFHGKKSEKTSGHDEIRTHDLPVISRAHHLAMLRALVLYYVVLGSIYIILFERIQKYKRLV